MKRKVIENIITDLLTLEELAVLQVTSELNIRYEADLTWETVGKYLRRMTEEGKLTRRTGERPDRPNQNWYGPGKKPWVFYYSLNNGGQQ